MDSLKPLGSVLEIGERRFVVVGHRMCRDGAQVGMGYVVVPYPLGFVGMQSLSVVPARAVGRTVAEGLLTDAGQAHLAQLEELARESEGISYNEYADHLLLLKGMAKEEAPNA